MLRAANTVIVTLKVFWVRDGVDRVYGSHGGRGGPGRYLDSRSLVSGEQSEKKKKVCFYRNIVDRFSHKRCQNFVL